MEYATIWDAWRRYKIRGKLIKRTALGIVIEERNEIRHYTDMSRVISIDEDGIKPTLTPHEKGLLF